MRADDSVHGKADKVRLLELFVNVENHQALLREFIVSMLSPIRRMPRNRVIKLGRHVGLRRRCGRRARRRRDTCDRAYSARSAGVDAAMPQRALDVY